MPHDLREPSVRRHSVWTLHLGASPGPLALTALCTSQVAAACDRPNACAHSRSGESARHERVSAPRQLLSLRRS